MPGRYKRPRPRPHRSRATRLNGYAPSLGSAVPICGLATSGGAATLVFPVPITAGDLDPDAYEVNVTGEGWLQVTDINQLGSNALAFFTAGADTSLEWRKKEAGDFTEAGPQRVPLGTTFPLTPIV